MSLRGYVGRSLELLLAGAAVALVVGAVIGQPILFGFVETGSMAPTLSPGDGFIAVPMVLAGDVDEGDVVVYRAQELDGGGLTTHRVVGKTDEGYITKGDANPFTDQSGPEPPVPKERIVAKALSVGGTTVVIPFMGTLVMTIRSGVQGTENAIATALGLGRQSHGAGVFLATMGVVLFALTAVWEWLGGPARTATRSRTRPGVLDTRKVAVVLLLVVLLPANAAMVLPGGTYELAVDGDAVARNPDLAPGERATWQYTYTNYGAMPVAFRFETASDAVSVPDSTRVLWGNANSTVEVTMRAPPPGERAVADVREFRYLLVLPPSVIGALHEAHPLLALLAVNAVLAAATLLVVRRILGNGPLRVRWGASVGFWTRLRRRLG